MCGIVGYIGKQKALPVLIDGIKSLEYRGYDSAGFAVSTAGGVVKSKKAVGRVSNLELKIEEKDIRHGNAGICHTRWATHGGVTEENAHPHSDCKGELWLCHNGIIENYKDFKSDLARRGHTFKSETDSEVLAHLIEEFKTQDPALATEEAVRLALLSVRGTYGLALLDSKNPGTLIAARNFSPLLIGVGDGEYIIASDASAVLKHTKNVVYLDDGEMAVLTPKSHKIFDLKRNTINRKSEELTWDIEEAQKGGNPHFMLKEILEEPEAIENSIRGRIVAKEGLIKLGGILAVEEKLRNAKRILIAGCGTAYLAGKVGEYMLEEYGGIPVKIELASEFRYRKPIFREGDVMLVVSQSGETADTLAALAEAKQKGVLSLGIVNVVGSTIARQTDAGVYQHVGPEIGVASTKAFTSQVAILALLSVMLGRQRDMSVVMARRITEELSRIPELMKKIIKQSEAIKKLAKKYQPYRDFLFLGRKYNYPVALEGALKLKEISYVHAEGFSAGEMKHGPIAMIDKSFPSICIAPSDSVYEKMVSNMEEIKARSGPIIVIATEGNKKIEEITKDVIYIPKTLEMLTPLLAVVPLQLFAYHFGVLRGLDVDKPRNLAKSVTVE
ncbi:MAG: glutamine--fructose-6-phosphate aminotransferase [Candidatus Sungbacteria bacterium RIFCSPLOWO2_01_FULL_47_32]|uniref:Glutamine--fructose-6-phosphate aminotransferase [isomerizing] n=1 Tax=Candidatus Sungbacteria bacterium RIFCSPHIGHO2_01_FULL_47_32 TaxID=1802264 RepID=A0A1G2K6Z3_9BACT|nr:MAG: Isomerizing Glutamine-fructose-6-phosphate aminotransferase [Parcubacteria group bacterium GW2011_GWA2_47_10]OGZ94250.1 MAG: glutamine--fructose-6-phosphate aminotransferase [Candidatus Sungbacteria bacterium RIFCSPHIGHO2_01_FULL_47_32]OGZ99719.1 MAG: glutamine--fructose-6-phosphate aminotransferase [Candidatus Sungbacteria bacterium RIFCSPHIGHO2_02_FULL_46_12]OHA05891.1 MAG: glutamine--fructose-6-phosphate aminotransferase [Candidatus Sungbacteria bacterium RIFCSPLOWO2_01_FULL_47_32]